MLASYPFASPDRVSVITQGYDDDSNCSLRRGDGEQFTIVYTGSVYPRLQSLVEFLKAVRAARADGIVVRFLRAGPKLPKDDTDQIERSDLGSVIQELGNVSRVEALAVQRKAALLLAVGHKSRDRIPGKTIEYIGARRPILSLSQGPYDLAANFVQEHGLGIAVPNEAGSILKALRQLHDLWRKGQLETIYHPTDVERFTWQHLAHRLEDIFREAGGNNLQDREICWRSIDEHAIGEDVEHPLLRGVMRRGH
jgi:glycosyltransferase involved in cell wall biosynthesis